MSKAGIEKLKLSPVIAPAPEFGVLHLLRTSAAWMGICVLFSDFSS